MSGTSLDGIDAALLRTDGEAVAERGAWLTVPYPADFRSRLAAALGRDAGLDDIARELTERHAEAVRRLLAEAGMAPGEVAVVGFHGQTIDHRPQDHVTVQIGDGALLAKLVGIAVVSDFRAADVAAGGEGAPFAPLYHVALAGDLDKPVAVLNIGGISNLTWIDADAAPIAFDCGPGNALLDQWAERHTGEPYDAEGRLAAAGRAVPEVVAAYLADPYYDRAPPKSLDRLDFGLDPLDGLGPADGAATLVEVTCAAIVRGLRFLPRPPVRWLVTGGGRRNPVMMARLSAMLGVPCDPIEALGVPGDALEAQAFAYLAVRSLRGLALSLPSTTGVPRPMPGGRLDRP